MEIASNVLGVSIGDERFLPFFAEAERLDLAVFVHAMPAATDRLPARRRWAPTSWASKARWPRRR